MWDALGAGHTPCSEPTLNAPPQAGRGPGPGAVRAPTGGSGHFLALQIPTGAGAHACIEGYGLRWPRSTYAISARSRPELESRSRRDRAREARPPKAVATYLTVSSGSWRYDLRRESCWAARGVPNGTRPRAHNFRLHGPGPRDPTKGERATGRRLGPPERPSTIPGANHIYKSQSARLYRGLRP